MSNIQIRALAPTQEPMDRAKNVQPLPSPVRIRQSSHDIIVRTQPRQLRGVVPFGAPPQKERKMRGIRARDLGALREELQYASPYDRPSDDGGEA